MNSVAYAVGLKFAVVVAAIPVETYNEATSSYKIDDKACSSGGWPSILIVDILCGCDKRILCYDCVNNLRIGQRFFVVGTSISNAP